MISHQNSVLGRNKIVADNIAKSCSLQGYEDSKDNLQKGEVSDMLTRGYGGGEALKFVKTGKQLKEIIPNTVANLKAKLVGIDALMETLKTQIGFEPTEKRNSGLSNSIFCNFYPYTNCSPSYDEATRSYPAQSDEQKLCSQFNDLCYNWRSIKEDIVSCNVIMNNLEDANKYTLSVSQLVALSSGDEEMLKGVEENALTMTEEVYESALQKGVLNFPLDVDDLDDTLEKGIGAERSHLQKKVVTDKKGNQRTVWVKSGESTTDKKTTSEEKGGGDSKKKEKVSKSKELHALYDADEDNEFSNFFDVVSQHYEPDDDGESEAMMLKNVAKSDKIDTILKELKAKIKTGNEESQKEDTTELPSRFKKLLKGKGDEITHVESNGSDKWNNHRVTVSTKNSKEKHRIIIKERDGEEYSKWRKANQDKMSSGKHFNQIDEEFDGRY